MKYSIEEKSASPEQLLLEYAQRLERYTSGRRGIIIHLSRLSPNNRREHHIRVAVNTFENLVKQFDGQIFLLTNHDIVFICKGASIAMIDDAIMRLRYLFSEDPLTADSEDPSLDRFATWFDLERAYDSFIQQADRYAQEELKRSRRLAALAGSAQAGVGQPVGDRRPLDPQGLGALVDSSSRADLSNLLRRQAVCAISPGEVPKPIFREIYISIPDLRDTLMPRNDLTADKWLFFYLTQTLDKRMLAMLKKNDDTAISASFSLNLNIQTLLSPEFLAFDTSLRAGTRGTIVIELQKADIFADLGAYVFARDFVKERGYRICLDGVTDIAIPFIDREGLGLDLIKIFWHPDMGNPARAERASAIRAALDKIGKARTILARCDTEEAVNHGLSMGVNLFQGRYIDRLLSSGTPFERPRNSLLQGTLTARR